MIQPAFRSFGFPFKDEDEIMVGMFLIVLIILLFFYFLLSKKAASESELGNTANRAAVGRLASQKWTRDVFKEPDKYVILDCETTGLGETDEIIQLAIIDLEGNTLFDSLIKPSKGKRISARASATHGITRDKLKNAPLFCDVLDEVLEILEGKKVLAYNAEFDARLFNQTMRKYADFDLRRDYNLNTKWECVMIPYSAYVGEWWESKQDYKWQKLSGGDHTALGDCLATFSTLKKMAG